MSLGDLFGVLAQMLGRAMNREVMERMDSMDKNICGIKGDFEAYKAESYRSQILRFGDEILHGVPHSKEHFDQVLRNIAKYDDYCDTHPEFENNVTGLTSQRIKEIYQQRMDRNDFL